MGTFVGEALRCCRGARAARPPRQSPRVCSAAATCEGLGGREQLFPPVQGLGHWCLKPLGEEAARNGMHCSKIYLEAVVGCFHLLQRPPACAALGGDWQEVSGRCTGCA